MSFTKILIANRGEIAVRVHRTARALGYRTVAVYSDADRGALHTEIADEAVAIGPSPPAESYLRVDRIIDAARRTDAGAVHPGYGFLAENPALARACEDAGLVFIGPSAEAIELMGDKARARARALDAGVPCIPGYDGGDQSLEAFARAAAEIGFPLMIKAVAGGGGHGLRRVVEASELAPMLERARSEAANAFGNGDLLLERYLERARHVEVQVFGDSTGQVIHLGERDCSLQRRHQKIIEECPSPAVDEALREAMGTAAVRIAKSVGYLGAGTVEFLLDGDRDFYFLEMNTRLQVEHPVTEMVTGLDLVAWQLRIAAGEPLPITQNEVRFEGHAIEARLYAEDPVRDFLPQAGEVRRFRPPASNDGVRVDAGIRTGSVVPPYYDPLVAKVVAWGESRDQTRRRLIAALEECVLFGPRHNRSFLITLLRDPTFIAGDADTELVESLPRVEEPPPDPGTVALAAVLISERDRRAGDPLWGFRNTEAAGWPLDLTCDDSCEVITVRVEPVGCGYRVIADGRTLDVELVPESTDTAIRYRCEGIERLATVLFDGHRLDLDDGCTTHMFTEATAARSTDDTDDSVVTAPMAARVAEVHAAAGDRVETGQCLMVLEAMKLQSRVEARRAGTVAEIRVGVDDQVAFRQVLAVLD
ncbi:MAG: acetyl-CoA carboxylase biotin carboxylase subunit [Thermoanaerobaculia bacterium]